MLTRAYGVDERRLEIIPHGVPNLPLVDPDTIKPRLGLEGRKVILSFGLLGPGKGYESAIAAMPAVVAADPDGAVRHPRRDPPRPAAARGRGLSRAASRRKAAALGVTDSRPVRRPVRRATSSSARWLEAADVFVTPYPNLDQIVSGTLSYAMGAGKAIVSTPYAYARERLAQAAAAWSPPGSSEALADGVHRAARGSRASPDARPAGLRLQPGHGLVDGRRRVRAHLRARARRCRRRPAAQGRCRTVAAVGG